MPVKKPPMDPEEKKIQNAEAMARRIEAVMNMSPERYRRWQLRIAARQAVPLEAALVLVALI